MKSFPSFCPEVEFYYMPVLEKMATLLNWLASNEGQNNTHGEIEQRLWNEGIEALRLSFTAISSIWRFGIRPPPKRSR